MSLEFGKINYMQERKYKTFATWCIEEFGHPIHKICLDGGFTCPNRDGSKGVGGCIFCGERGAGEHVNPEQTIEEEARAQLNHYERRKEKGGFVAYFQNFTNTYADPNTLKKIYNSALISDKIEAVAIATRPDCINEEILEVIKEIPVKKVWVELGLQTSSDITAERINRCYKSEEFTKAVSLFNKYNIDVVVHIIVGLPGETFEDFKNTIEFINKHKIQGIKIHSLYVMKNTQLEVYYNKNEYKTIDLEYYIDCVVYAISHLNKDIVIHRLIGECAKNLLVAPIWDIDKNELLSQINKRLENLN